MARARNIKPSIMDNDELAALDPLNRLLFIYLWMLADKEGRLEDRPKRIAAQALPYDRTADVGAMLDDLQSAGFIVRYSVEGLNYIQIMAFSKHQNPHVREADSEIPGIDHEKAVLKHNLGSAEASPRSPDSGFRIPDPGFSDSGLGTPQVKPARTRKARANKIPMPEDFGISERVKAWAVEHGYSQLEQHLEAFKRKSAARAYAYASWDDAFMEAIREDWAKLRGRAANGSAPGPESSTDPERRAAIEAEGQAKGLGRWDEIKEPWHAYKARVRGNKPSAVDPGVAALVSGAIKTTRATA